jgi:hypothetical protein
MTFPQLKCISIYQPGKGGLSLPAERKRLLLIGLFSLEAVILLMMFLCLRVESLQPPIEASSTLTLTLEAPTGSLKIINPRGKLVIKGEETAQVELTAQKTAFGRAQEEVNRLLEEIDLRQMSQDGEVILQVDLPEPVGAGRVDLELVLPSRLGLVIQTGLGDVFIQGMQGPTQVSSQIGDIEIHRFAGDLSIEAGLGRILIQDAIILQELTVWASMGDVEFAGSPGAQGKIRANTGDIALHLPEGVPLDLIVQAGACENERAMDKGTLGPGPIQGCLAIWADMGKVSIKGLEVEPGD